MFERFTAIARRTVVLSQEEARRLDHNYIGTEHILLGLLGEREGVGCRVLERFDITLDWARQEVLSMIGQGQQSPKGHIPFTPRAKKVLELSLREALQLRHNYIGTEHILLGLIREGDGVAAQIMRKKADLLAVRAAVLDEVPAGPAAPEGGLIRRWARRLTASEQLGGLAYGRPEPGDPAVAGVPAEETGLTATPAADATLAAAAKLAGERPVGSHHLLLAAIADANSAAAKALTALGVDLDQATESLRGVDITGTSDEQPEEAGRRQLNISVDEETVTVVATDPVLVKSANAALKALAATPGSAVGAGAAGHVIRGADLTGPAATRLGTAWRALHEALDTIARTAPPGAEEEGTSDDR